MRRRTRRHGGGLQQLQLLRERQSSVAAQAADQTMAHYNRILHEYIVRAYDRADRGELWRKGASAADRLRALRARSRPALAGGAPAQPRRGVVALQQQPLQRGGTAARRRPRRLHAGPGDAELRAGRRRREQHLSVVLDAGHRVSVSMA